MNAFRQYCNMSLSSFLSFYGDGDKLSPDDTFVCHPEGHWVDLGGFVLIKVLQ